MDILGKQVARQLRRDLPHCYIGELSLISDDANFTVLGGAADDDDAAAASSSGSSSSSIRSSSSHWNSSCSDSPRSALGTGVCLAAHHGRQGLRPKRTVRPSS